VSDYLLQGGGRGRRARRGSRERRGGAGGAGGGTAGNAGANPSPAALEAAHEGEGGQDSHLSNKRPHARVTNLRQQSRSGSQARGRSAFSTVRSTRLQLGLRDCSYAFALQFGSSHTLKTSLRHHQVAVHHIRLTAVTPFIINRTPCLAFKRLPIKTENETYVPRQVALLLYRSSTPQIPSHLFVPVVKLCLQARERAARRPVGGAVCQPGGDRVWVRAG